MTAFARAKIVVFEALIVVCARMASKSIEIVAACRKSERKIDAIWLPAGVDWASMSERSMNEVHDGSCCAVAATSDLIGSKWTALIVHDLSEGARRFTELERACTGISPRTLSERLHMLELEDIVARRSYPESPPRVEYELTDKGVALLPIIDAMSSFGHSWLIDDHDHEHVTRPRVGLRA